MSFDLSAQLDPARCALLVFECQQGVIGADGFLPGLSRAVAEGHVVEHIATLIASGREAGVPVVHCSVRKRADGLGNPFNTPLEMRMRAAQPGAGVPQPGPIVPELAPAAQDIVVERAHGLTGFYESGLDPYLRNMGVRSVVLTGVSVNIGILATAIEAVNRGYSVVVPTDCVAGDPPAYAEQALRYAVRNVALLSTLDEIRRVWNDLATTARR